jgi:hypothetical protein
MLFFKEAANTAIESDQIIASMIVLIFQPTENTRALLEEF